MSPFAEIGSEPSRLFYRPIVARIVGGASPGLSKRFRRRSATARTGSVTAGSITAFVTNLPFSRVNSILNSPPLRSPVTSPSGVVSQRLRVWDQIV